MSQGCVSVFLESNCLPDSRL